MSDIRRLVGMKLKNLMEEKEVSQLELSRKTGISQSTISAMLPGMDDAKKYPATSYENILALAKFFNVSVDWLLGNSEYRSTSQSIKIAAKTTGLSDAAISVLRDLKKKSAAKAKNDSYEYDILYAINTLILSDKGNDIIENICHYLITDFDAGNYSIEELHVDDSGNPNEYYEEHNNRPIEKIYFERAVVGHGHGIAIDCKLMRYALTQAISSDLEQLRKTVIAESGMTFEQRRKLDEEDYITYMEKVHADMNMDI